LFADCGRWSTTRRLNVTPKTTEQRLSVRSGKSDAAITNKTRI